MSMSETVRRRVAKLRDQLPDGSGKLTTASAAMSLIKPGSCVCVAGFVGRQPLPLRPRKHTSNPNLDACTGLGIPEHLLNALRRAHDDTGQPSNLTVINVAVGGTRQGRGMAVLAKAGLTQVPLWPPVIDRLTWM